MTAKNVKFWRLLIFVFFSKRRSLMNSREMLAVSASVATPTPAAPSASPPVVGAHRASGDDSAIDDSTHRVSGLAF